MISTSFLFFHFHTVLLYFLCIPGLYFDAWMRTLETFACSYRVWVCLYAFYVWFLVYFIGSVLDSLWDACNHVLISIWNPFDLIHLHLSPLTTYEMRLRLINPWFPYSCYVFINFLLYTSLLLCIWLWNVVVCVSPSESISPGIESCGYEVLASKEFLRNILSSFSSV